MYERLATNYRTAMNISRSMETIEHKKGKLRLLAFKIEECVVTKYYHCFQRWSGLHLVLR